MSLNVNAPVFYPNSVMTLKREYETLIKKFDRYQNKGDNEMSHTIQDEIYRKFIKDIESGNLGSIEAAKMISSLIVNKVIVYDKNRWYA